MLVPGHDNFPPGQLHAVENVADARFAAFHTIDMESETVWLLYMGDAKP